MKSPLFQQVLTWNDKYLDYEIETADVAILTTALPPMLETTSKKPCCHACYRLDRFNLVIEVLVVSSFPALGVRPRAWIGFNLVIEVLVVSRLKYHFRLKSHLHSFNLVIEVLVVSRALRSPSRKRCMSCFNLVIEVLVVSSWTFWHGIRKGVVSKWFQSRNRGTCCFKKIVTCRCSLEFLFQSRNRGTCCFKNYNGGLRRASHASFNLVIEVLVVSRWRSKSLAAVNGFVSIS